MSKANKPAFPMQVRTQWLNRYGESAEDIEDVQGITKREYFAGLAMQGIYANKEYNKLGAKECAGLAVEAVDALLAELEKQGTEKGGA